MKVFSSLLVLVASLGLMACGEAPTKTQALSLDVGSVSQPTTFAPIVKASTPETAAAPTSAHWTARMSLSDESRYSKCTTKHDSFEFVLTGEHLMVRPGSGGRIEVELKSGPLVDVYYGSQFGDQIRLLGDVRTRKMSATNVGFKCTWDLIPE